MKVEVLGRKYKVKYTCPDKMKKEIGFTVYGFCDLDSDTIYIDKKLAGKKSDITLYHEIVHCVLHRIGADQVLSHEMQEVLCESIGNSFFELTDKDKRKRLREIERLRKEVERLREIIELAIDNSSRSGTSTT